MQLTNKSSSQRIEKLIRLGRGSVMAFVMLELTGLVAYFSIATYNKTPDERSSLIDRWLNPFGFCFFILSFVLFLSVYFLLNRLRNKKKQAASSQADREFFNREMCELLAVLIIFSSTYILRGSWDIKMTSNLTEFWGMIESLSIGIICDFAPVMLLLVFHFKNFYKKNEVSHAEV